MRNEKIRLTSPDESVIAGDAMVEKRKGRYGESYFEVGGETPFNRVSTINSYGEKYGLYKWNKDIAFQAITDVVMRTHKNTVGEWNWEEIEKDFERKKTSGARIGNEFHQAVANYFSKGYNDVNEWMEKENKQAWENLTIKNNQLKEAQKKNRTEAGALTDLHESVIEAYAHGRFNSQEEGLVNERYLNVCKAFNQWIMDFNPQLIASEIPFIHKKKGYAGTADLIASITTHPAPYKNEDTRGRKRKPKTETYLIDFKTSKSVSEDNYLQIAAYYKALSKVYKIDHIAIVHLCKETGKYTFHVYTKQYKKVEFVNHYFSIFDTNLKGTQLKKVKLQKNKDYKDVIGEDRLFTEEFISLTREQEKDQEPKQEEKRENWVTVEELEYEENKRKLEKEESKEWEFSEDDKIAGGLR